jgi:hypothetical protein
MTFNTRKTVCQPDADAWSDVEDFRDFPILASTRQSFRRLLSKANLSFDGLANIAEQDPAICLHMLLRIAKSNPKSLLQVSSAAGCISLLGMEGVVQLVKQLPLVSEHSTRRSEKNYVAMLHTAALAGRLAGQWAKLKPGMNQHQAHWAAMLASAPFWPWHLVHVEASQEVLHQLSNNKEISPAFQDCFSTLDKKHLQRWHNLAKRLSLPNVCQSLWKEGLWPTIRSWKTLRQTNVLHIDDNKQLKHQCQQSEMLIYCSNMLAMHYRIGVYRTKSQRWAKLAAHLLNLEPSIVHRQVIDQSLQLARQGMLLSSVNSLLAPSHSRISYSPAIHCQHKVISMAMERDAPIAVSTPVTVPTNTQVARKIDQAIMKKLLHQLNQEAACFGDWHSLMKSVLKGITEGIGLKHAYVMVQNKLGTAAKVYYQQGLADTDPLCQFGIALDKASVFKKMLEKPASLMITEQNREKMLRGISATQQSVLPQQFMMMSLFSNDRPIGIIFADLGNSEHNLPMQPSEYIAFKSLCMAANKSLGKLATATKKTVSANNSKATQRRA